MLSIKWEGFDPSTENELPPLVHTIRLGLTSVDQLAAWAAKRCNSAAVNLWTLDYSRKLSSRDNLVSIIEKDGEVVVQPTVQALREQRQSLRKRDPIQQNGQKRNFEDDEDDVESVYARSMKKLKRDGPMDDAFSSRSTFPTSSRIYRGCTFIEGKHVHVGSDALPSPGRALQPQLQQLPQYFAQPSIAAHLGMPSLPNFSNPYSHQAHQSGLLHPAAIHKPTPAKEAVKKPARMVSDASKTDSDDDSDVDLPIINTKPTLKQNTVAPKPAVASNSKQPVTAVAKGQIKPTLTAQRPVAVKKAAPSSESDDEFSEESSAPKEVNAKKNPSQPAGYNTKPEAKKYPSTAMQTTKTTVVSNQIALESTQGSQTVQKPKAAYSGILETVQMHSNKEFNKFSPFVMAPQTAKVDVTKPVQKASQQQPKLAAAKPAVSDDDSSSDEDSSDLALINAKKQQLVALMNSKDQSQPPRTGGLTTGSTVEPQRPLTVNPPHVADRQSNQSSTNCYQNKTLQQANPMSRFIKAGHPKAELDPYQNKHHSSQLGAGIKLDLSKLQQTDQMPANYIEVQVDKLRAMGDRDRCALLRPDVGIAYRVAELDDDMVSLRISKHTVKAKVALLAGKLLGVQDVDGDEEADDEIMLDTLFALWICAESLIPSQRALLDQIRTRPAEDSLELRKQELASSLDAAEQPYIEHKQPAPVAVQAIPVLNDKNDPDSSDDEAEDTETGAKGASKVEIEKREFEQHKETYRKIAEIDATMSEREKKITHQVNYYFGDKNYFNDKFIQNHVEHDADKGRKPLM